MLTHNSKSSMFDEVTYNEEDKILTITFKKGGAYDYLEAPREIYDDLTSSESEGKYFLSHIKNAFKCEKR